MDKKKMLLHSCCAPCASGALWKLDDEYDVTLLYYNPCIYPKEEFDKRLESLKKLAKLLNLPLVVPPYHYEEFLDCAGEFAHESEGGKRCRNCIEQRLAVTAQAANELGFDCFATTLTVSPKKNAVLINSLGKDLEQDYAVEYIQTDFKKGDGYLMSINLCKEYSLYRQKYCGCEFSV